MFLLELHLMLSVPMRALFYYSRAWLKIISRSFKSRFNNRNRTVIYLNDHKPLLSISVDVKLIIKIVENNGIFKNFIQESCLQFFLTFKSSYQEVSDQIFAFIELHFLLNFFSISFAFLYDDSNVN